jgi:nucleotide-binding universal stress UspA family protein
MKTNNISKVLIALDYNPTAKKVAEVGFSLAKSMNASIVLLHVAIDPVFYSASGYSPIMGFTGYDYNPEVMSDSVQGLRDASFQFLNKTKEHLGDDTIQTMVKEGDFADRILETADEIKADIIVVGSHSQKWLENVLIGSVTEKILHKSTIPLFIIPTKKTD